MQCCYVLYNTSFLIMIMSRIQRKRTFITKTVGTNINRFDLKNTRGGQGPGASRPVFIFRCSFAKFTLCKWQNCQANHFYLTASFISDYLHCSPSLFIFRHPFSLFAFFAIPFHFLHFCHSFSFHCLLKGNCKDHKGNKHHLSRKVWEVTRKVFQWIANVPSLQKEAAFTFFPCSKLMHY